jgi:hypothetical protein
VASGGGYLESIIYPHLNRVYITVNAHSGSTVPPQQSSKNMTVPHSISVPGSILDTDLYKVRNRTPLYWHRR